MEYNTNPSQFNPGRDNSPQGSVPPPPPAPEQQVGVRTMNSDLESVQQTGGDSPQSQVISAPELSALRNNQAPAQPQYQPQPQPQQPILETIPAPPQSFTEESSQVVDVSEKSSKLKTIILVVVIVVLAVAVGFGVYYLISSLNKTPQATVPTPPIQEQNIPVVETPIPQPEVVVPPAPVHVSVISNPTKTETVAIDLSGDFKLAITKPAEEKLLVGSVKELLFVDAQNNAVAAASIFGKIYPSGGTLPFSVSDATYWLYADKTGGNKFGTVFEVSDLTSAKTSLSPILESADIAKTLFVSDVTVPAKPEFKDGQVEGQAVRFLAFNAKTNDVFEYAWMSVAGKNYLVIATSYNQMVDIIKRLKAIPQVINPLITSTSTATTSTSTLINP